MKTQGQWLPKIEAARALKIKLYRLNFLIGKYHLPEKENDMDRREKLVDLARARQCLEQELS